MSAMENRDEVLQLLERFTRLKQKEIPRELEDYLTFVARTGDTVYPWAAVKYFFRTKLSHVIMDFHDNTPSIADLPQCPNVDPFCYDRMKRTLLSRMESFNSAPFTIQRICELLNEPRKHYTRIDKFMRAVEKNILVVSTQEPGRRRSDSENGDSLDSIVNGDLEVNVDIEMDNEAFGIDSSEMAPNAAGVAGVVPPVNITTPAHAEEVPPTMEPAEEQETEKQLADDEPKLAPAENDVSDSKPEETVSSEVNGSDKDGSEVTDEAAVTVEKSAYSADVELNTPEASSLEDPTVEPPPDVIDSAAAIVHEQKELDEPLPEAHSTTAVEATPESPDTSQPLSSAEPSVLAPATETESEPVDDEEPKAKMAKLSQEEPEVEPTAAKPLTEEPVTETEPTDPVSVAVVSASTEELSESDVVSVFPSTESIQSVEPEVNISSGDLAGSSVTSIPDTVSTDSDSVDISSVERSGSGDLSYGSESTDSNSASSLPAVEEVTPSALETPAEQEQTVHEPQTSVEPATESTPSEPSSEVVAPVVEEEPVVKSVEIEVQPPAEEPAPEQPAVNPDEMETVPSVVVPENVVMATDEEEQPPHSDEVTDTVVPMADADVTETTSKPDENAMDIDESSVEPMDQ